ncbi:MAG: M48 family metallopeptidase [Actinomycetota bacterium]
MTAMITGQLSVYDVLDPPAPPPAPPPLAVEVTRSRRRKKTAEARVVGSTLQIRIPAACSGEEERYFVEHFQRKFERSRTAALIDLDRRAARLAATYDLPTPASIRWVSNQHHQWGSCTPGDRSIRLSDRLAGFPTWVVDYVVVHELAHLVEADHGPRFWALVNRYPKSERARGYLLAKDEG